jgi:hypothetical protein
MLLSEGVASIRTEQGQQIAVPMPAPQAVSSDQRQQHGRDAGPPPGHAHGH